MVNASSGRIFVTIPSDHFRPILVENDLERNQGVFCWRIVDTSLELQAMECALAPCCWNCRTSNLWCSQVVMKMMRIMENGFSTVESSGIMSLLRHVIRWLNNRCCSRSNSQYHRSSNTITEPEAWEILGSRSLRHCILLFLDWYWSALLMNSSLYQFFR